ncbi:hypothetical protein BRD03_14350 [Halobacteriales archaeon QS_9_68_17]|nr:MAG: hypothetical protein BRD03_14350 [Halobacteriales archaeon QS_9_68_17]
MGSVRKRLTAPTTGKLLAVVVGFSVGTLLSPEPLTVPLVGTVPGVVAVAAGLAGGGLLYARMPGRGCSRDCGRS